VIAILNLLLAAFLGPTPAPDCEEPTDEQPNIVWVFWDASHLDGQGAAPVLEGLLQEAQRFPRTHVPVPMGRPHRTALLSGLWPRESGVCFEAGPQRGGLERTILADLAEAGYRSYQYGSFATRLPKEASFDGESGSAAEPLAFENFLKESGDAPRFVCFAVEVPSAKSGGPQTPQARRSFLDAKLGGLRAALKADANGRETLWFLIAEQPQGGADLDPDQVLEPQRTRCLAVVHPRSFARKETHTLISSLALYATLADYAGIDPVVENLAPSLRTLLEGGSSSSPERIFGTLYNTHASGRSGTRVGREVVAMYSRDERWKYVLFLSDVGVDIAKGGETATIVHARGSELLFDLEVDPLEEHNLAEALSYEDRVRRLREETIAWWEAFGGGKLPVPYFSPPLGPPPKDDRPNIVLIISDDHDYEHLGFLGNKLVQTPTLDRLAEEGVVFPIAHVPVSRCRPSLASLLSGRWPHETGVYDNRTAHPLRAENSLPNLLKQAGYATFVGGKYWEGRTRAMGFLEPEVLDVRFRHFVRKSQDQLFDFVERNAGERPFFVWWAPMLPHTPFDPPERYREPFEEVVVPVPAALEGDSEEFQALERTAFAMEAWFDDGLGALVEKLKQTGEYDNTLFCFLIDNGWANGYPSKGTVFEKGLRTPVFFTWPKSIRGGRRNEALVSTIDLYATLLDYARVPVPANSSSRSVRPLIEGGPANREVLYGVGYRYNEKRRKKGQIARDVFSIYARTARYKFILYLKDVQDPELFKFIHHCAPFPARRRGDRDFFDLKSDPYEEDNLAGDPRHAAEMERLYGGWREWWKEVHGPELNLP